MILSREYARLEVALPAPGLAAVRFVPRGEGSGRGVPADRLDLTLGLVAWTVHRMHEDHGPAFGEAVKRLASAIADSADGSIPEGILRASGRGAAPMEVRVTDWPSARGGTRVQGVLTRSAVGPVTVLKSPPKSPQVLGLAALVAGAWDARQEDAHGRLALALAMEGILAWYREAHRMTPPRQAVEAARMHAIDRLEAADRGIPPALG